MVLSTIPVPLKIVCSCSIRYKTPPESNPETAMNTTARSTQDAYYAHAPELLDTLSDNPYAVARYIYSKNPPTDTASQFSIVYPLKAPMVRNIRVGAARTSRIPLRIGPALVWMIDRAAVSPERCLQVLTTGGPGAGLEVYALLFAERAVEVTSWFPKVHAWRKDLAYGLRPAAASKLEADLTTSSIAILIVPPH